MRKIIIDKNNENQRIDKMLLKFIPDMPKSFLYKMFRKKNIKLNKKKIEGVEIIKDGDIVDIFMSDDALVNFGADKNILEIFQDSKEDKKQNIEDMQNAMYNAVMLNSKKDNKKSGRENMRRPNLEVVYEDNDMLIVNKPENILVHPDESDGSEMTILSEAIGYLEYKKDRTYMSSRAMGFKPAVCNRLDRNTTGLVMIGKSFRRTQEINQMIQDGEISKKYLCVVCGKVETKEEELVNYYRKDEEENRAYIYDNEEKGTKEIRLRYKVLKRGFNTSLLEVELLTGKSHQIRAQLAHINHPIVGDIKYGNSDINDRYAKKMKVTSQLLCAYMLVIDNKTYQIDCDFEKYVD